MAEGGGRGRAGIYVHPWGLAIGVLPLLTGTWAHVWEGLQMKG